MCYVSEAKVIVVDVDFPHAPDTAVHGEAARQEMLSDLKWTT